MKLRFTALLFLGVLAACSRAPDGTHSEVGLLSLFDPVAANPSLCGSPAIPYPNNALFSGSVDGTLNIPNSSAAPFVTAANLTDGFSTTASMFTDVLGAVDFDTASDAVLIFEADATPRFLEYGVDFTLQPSVAMAQLSGTGHSAGTCTGLVPARFLPISDQRSRILIEPLKPLNPSTTYIVAVTNRLKSKDGIAALPNEFFEAVNTDTKICRLSAGEAGTELVCSEAGAGVAAAGIEPVLAYMNATQLATLETLRRSLVRPIVTALEGAHGALLGTPLTDDELVIAWAFTTQSIDLTLSRLDTDTQLFQVINTTISTGDLGLGLEDTATIYAGIVNVPYYLANTSADSHAPLASYWINDGTLNAVNPPALGGAVPCSALGTPESTSICYPDPEIQSRETIPVMVTAPNLKSGHLKPANGWPVVVFQHGITRNRTDMLAIAPTLASAGFVTVAIDQPLHGLTDDNPDPAVNPFYRNQLFTGGPAAALITDERTFGLDLYDDTPDPNPCAPTNFAPDGVIDASGTHFVNLASLATSRDNLRQAEADILHVVRSIQYLDLDNNPSTDTADDIDETRINFVGHSLGAIVGTAVLGVDATLIQAASLHVPGGGLGKLLDASASIGPEVSAGLGCNYVFEGTDTYETFVRFAQHLVDPADPINYAVAANANHPIHLVEVIGDTVVPNAAGSTCPVPAPTGLVSIAATVDAAGTAAASGVAGAMLVGACPPVVIPADPPLAAITEQDETVITGFLSGTDALVRVMGLEDSVTMGNVPFATQSPGGADTVVQFAPDTAEHGTVLTPDSSAVAGADATFLAATCEMQRQTAAFLATNGTAIPLGGSCP